MCFCSLLRSTQIYSSIFFSICHFTVLIPFYIYWFLVLVAYFYFYLFACVFRVVLFIFGSNENFAWQPIKIKPRDASVCVNGNTRNLYANIFVSTLYFMLFRLAMAFCVAAAIRTVSLSARFHFICSVSENNSNQKVEWKQTIQWNKRTQQKLQVHERVRPKMLATQNFRVWSESSRPVASATSATRIISVSIHLCFVFRFSFCFVEMLQFVSSKTLECFIDENHRHFGSIYLWCEV